MPVAWKWLTASVSLRTVNASGLAWESVLRERNAARDLHAQVSGNE